jgi:lipase chaperone LimK
MLKAIKGRKTKSKKAEDCETKEKKLRALAKVLPKKDRERIRKLQLQAEFMQNLEEYAGGFPTKDEAMYEEGKKKVNERMELIWLSFKAKK